MSRDPIKSAVDRAEWALVIRGVLAIAVGTFIIVRPLASVAAFAVLVALWALVQGVVIIAQSFDLGKMGGHRWLMLLSGIISVLFGIAALYYYPVLSLTYAVLWVAFWLMIAGIMGISIAVHERRMQMSWGWTMAWGVLNVIVGVGAFANPPVTLTVLLAVISAFGIVGGVMLLVGALRLHNAEDSVTAAMRTASHS